MASPRRPRLTAADWVDAALVSLAEGGLPAVAVEPLAVRLGATKGSFYWHFANRDALIVAALARWEERHTQEIIDAAEAAPDPAQRLRTLFNRVMGSVGRSPLEAQLLAAADHQLVGDVVRRVVARRLEYLVELFEQLGFAAEDARHRAVLMYAAYAGHDQLALRLPGALAVDDVYREAVVHLALTGAPTRSAG